ncbi:PQQ-dependent sugar dehydrogenase [Gallaecimonas xiamenensis]|uniref:Glucose sorbosone dehydrogenase n=1 Tax=Gallaecimonas xiamenensis 3-C-1 TaxID=745411 RepID=K2KIT2_9GAMM|nr:PQQ-dependent sugar dehydrogenase [Gallaecimonas xiamenensis]EKE77145.1 glucose sorbosone dehydrogenase [Gallaecimonas xiamenensis 3-C-1]
MKALFWAWLALLPGLAQAITTEQAEVEVQTLVEGLDHPWGLAFMPDGRMLVTERSGQLRLVDKDGKLSDPIKGLPRIAVAGQGGLLDVAWYQGQVYFSYAEPGPRAGTNSTAVARARLEGDRLTGLEVIFRQAPKYGSNAHFGSRLAFAPDGNLFITLGERYSARDDAQRLDNHHGKVVRIAPDGSVPKDNPFVGKAGALPEIWSYGHRNMQGATIHPQTGALWTHEHGPQGGDEVNLDQGGNNYGWPVVTFGEEYGGGKIGQGQHQDGMTDPLHVWVPSIAPSGMAFYTGDKFPQWRGDLFIGSLKFMQLVRLELDGTQVVGEERMLMVPIGQRIRDVVQGPDGYLYLVTDHSNGRILRIKPANEA